jgi:N-acetylmuramoyl-L-alanine amidase
MFTSLARCVLAAVLSLAVTTPLLAQDATRKLIVIDAGHGGSDPGAKASSGVLEKDVTLAYAQELADALIAGGAAVKMIRTTDTAVSLNDRAASVAHAALLLSIHTAAAPTASRSGIRLYIPKDDPASEQVATLLAAQLLELGTKLTPTQQADFAVFRDLPCPAVMVELGHLTNADDALLMTDPDFQRQATAAMVMALQAAGLVPAGE